MSETVVRAVEHAKEKTIARRPPRRLNAGQVLTNTSAQTQRIGWFAGRYVPEEFGHHSIT